MSRREDKVTRAAHIKKHTRGTSNEISFSVLDAAKNALDGDANDVPHAPRFGGISLFTLPGRRKKPAPTPTKERGLPLSTGDFVSVEDSGPVPLPSKPALPVAASTSSASPAPKPLAASSAPAKPKRSPEEEIARRKARRKMSKIVAITVIVLITIGLLVAGGLYLYHEFQNQRSNVATLDEALNLVSRADETIKKLDAVVADPFASSAADTRSTVQANLPATEQLLQDADEKARAMSLELRGAKDKEAANQTVAAIAARRSLITQGTVLMNAAAEAQDASTRVDEAWKTVLQADDLARQAAKLITDTTVENVEASKEKTNEALAAFDSALGAFNDVQYVYQLADFSPFVEYIQKRKESLGYAVASNDALLAKDKEEATAQNNAYNIADAEAATLAKALPEDPSSVVDEAFETATAETLKAYSTARLQAGSADAFINDYLGAETK